MGGPCAEAGSRPTWAGHLCPSSRAARLGRHSSRGFALPPLKGSLTTTASVLPLPAPEPVPMMSWGVQQGLQGRSSQDNLPSAHVVQQLAELRPRPPPGGHTREKAPGSRAPTLRGTRSRLGRGPRHGCLRRAQRHNPSGDLRQQGHYLPIPLPTQLEEANRPVISTQRKGSTWE